tara:strand:- start:8 stop:454 length:447 start_codon:yes stop_codon:yes gene_type:complete
MRFPKIKKCPCCNKTTFIKTNGIAYENSFASLQNYTIKKIFNCTGCGQNIALFLNTETGSEKLLWTEYLRAMDVFYLKNNELKKEKNKILENYETSHPRSKTIMAKIKILEKAISAKQSNLRIKLSLIYGKTNEVFDDLVSNHNLSIT